MVGIAADNPEMYSRSFRTKMRVVEALDRLCEDKPFAKIRIEDIVKESGVSRSNFYHNFEDKNAAVNWIGDQCHRNGIFRVGRDLTWFEGHMITTRDMCRFRILFDAAGEGRDYESAVPHFVRNRQQNLRETITEFKHMEINDKLDFQIQAFPYCEMTMAARFRAGGLPYGLKTFCNYLVDMTPRELYVALAQPAAETFPGEVADFVYGEDFAHDFSHDFTRGE